MWLKKRRRNIMKVYKLLVILFSVVFFSCSSNNFEDISKVTTYRIAVVMPQERQDEWERIADWALQNIASSQVGLPEQVRLDIEWHDENSSDFETWLKNVANDNSYMAVVGPYSSSHAHTAANLCGKSGKTLILPIATSTELQRIYAGKPNIWNLVQSDINQCELMLAQAVISESRTVSLLTTDDEYGKSFSDWFAYQAVELGLNVGDVFICSSEDDVKSAVSRIASGFKYDQHLLLAPSRESFAVTFDKEVNQLRQNAEQFRFPHIICSDAMRSPTLANQLKALQYEGLSPCAAPISGFTEAHRAKFGEEPSNGTAHLYDALMLLAYALTVNENNLNDAILKIVEGRESWNRGWLPVDMHDTFFQLQNGGNPDISGVTGDWTFDDRHHSGVLNTSYSHWILRDGAYYTLEYLSSDGTPRTTSSLQAWDVQNQTYQEFSNNQENILYPEHSGENWAVVIATSDKWAYYRHQADALAMYQLLKRHGYDDEHIILIIADNIAYDSHNIYPGVVKIKPDGENVYKDAIVDYKLNEININQLKRIMLGDNGFKNVLSSDKNDNVVVFWCGHGDVNSLAWGEYNVVHSWQIKDIINSMQGRYRKMLWVMDTCYSGSVGETCIGALGVLFITSANAYEPSKADMKDPEMGIWLSNGFTRAFQDAIDENPHITMRNLYYKLARETVGSHATVYNYSFYGNMFNNTMQEYLK